MHVVDRFALDQPPRTNTSKPLRPSTWLADVARPLLFALVAAGLGVAVVPELALPCNLAGSAVTPLRHPAARRHVFLATRVGTARRPSIAAAVTALREASAAPPLHAPRPGR